ncbi:hypothetical protein CYMTET_38936 [Cymbomonas tetramitiformis]|uniref:tRNA (guanine(46)-N(7))-methyltransferase n=1 Tax=Cymbomonas tetramitiformis TaxID=36881 RepID=A0AAE0CCF0_9CHLO|nr:hypothetical protein CYMTET_38936 [Cymbomonas tetramitiformis]
MCKLWNSPVVHSVSKRQMQHYRGTGSSALSTLQYSRTSRTKAHTSVRHFFFSVACTKPSQQLQENSLPEERAEPPKMRKVRSRLHVNPLSPEFAALPAVPDWSALFEDPTKPLHVDLGCCEGELLFALGPQQPEMNYVGVDIRERVVDRAKQWAAHLQLRNVSFVAANVQPGTLPHLFQEFTGKVRILSIICPDPYIQKRWRNRRIVKTGVVDDIASLLSPGGEVVIASEYEEVASEMRQLFLENASFRLPGSTTYESDGAPAWEEYSPFKELTARERTARFANNPIYRVVLERAA